MKPTSLTFNRRYARALRAYVAGDEARPTLDRTLAVMAGAGGGSKRNLAGLHAAIRGRSIPATDDVAERKAFERRAADFLHYALASQLVPRGGATPPPRTCASSQHQLRTEISRRRTAETALRDSKREQT